MFKKQKLTIDSLSELKPIISEYGLNVEWISPILQHSLNFKVRFPLVGAFSSGKSSLLNALIGESVFATSIDPQTGVPAELSYSESAVFKAHFADGSERVIDKNIINDNDLSSLSPDGWVEVKLPAENLQMLPHLLLVDMPGWDSGIYEHSRAIDQYAPRSLAYGLVVSAEEGNLRESIRNALLELKVLDMPVMVIITKCEKKTPEEVQAVTVQIQREVESALGREPFSVICVSARKKDIEPFKNALSSLEAQSEKIFDKKIIQETVRQLSLFANYLNTLLNKDDLNSEQIVLKQQEITRDMSSFEQRLNDETHVLDDKKNAISARILSGVRTSLLSKLDSLTNQAMHGGDLSGSLGSAIRISVADGVRNEFLPEIKRYIKNVDTALPDTFRVDATIASIKQTDNNYETIKVSSVFDEILDFVAPVMTIGGRLNVFLPIISGVLKLLEGIFGSSNKAVQEAERLENIRQQILNSVIPSALQQTECVLVNLLEEKAVEVKLAIVENIQAQRQQAESALQVLSEQLSKGKHEFKLQCDKYQHDLQKVENIIRALEA